MALHKYYSLDECTDQDKIYEILNELMSEAKISYKEIDTDIIKITDRGLTNSEIKSILSKFSKFDVLMYTDLDDSDDEDDDIDEYDDDDEYIWED